MKTKAFVAIMVTVLLVFSAFHVLPVRAQPFIRIGVIGPVGWPQWDGMWRGAELARDWINGPGGGIVIDGTRYDVSLHPGDEHSIDMRPDLGALEMERLITVEQVDFVIGGVFRIECVWAMREVAMDYNKLFFIVGAATDELIDGGPADTTPNVRTDYDRYKYLFRNTPSQTTLVYNLLGFLRGYVLPYRMAPLYGSPVNVAVIAENLYWTFDPYLDIVYGGYLGPQANIVFPARTPWNAVNFVPYLDAMHAAEVRLVVHLFSAPASIVFITQMAAHPLKAVPVGIDVLAQGTEFWSLSGGTWDPPFPGYSSVKGECEYETLLAASGTRTPVSTVSQPLTTVGFWDQYFAAYGSAPIYTSFAAYDTIIAMHDTLENAGVHPPFGQAEADALIPIIEQTYREGILGRFKYTASHPMSESEYATHTIAVGPNAGQTYLDVNPPRWQSPLGQYLDSDGSGDVTVGDTRLTDVTVSTASWENGTYRDNDGSGSVTVGDTRLTDVTVGETTYPAHTHVWEGDYDIGIDLTADAPTTYLAHTYVEGCNYDIGIDLTADAPTTYLAHTYVEGCNYDIGDPLEWIRLPGTLHDVFSNEYGSTWTQRYVRPLAVQWQAGRHEVVWPLDQPYSKMWALPQKMYPYPTDVNQDGQVSGADLLIEGYAVASYAVSPYFFDPIDGSWGKAHPFWQFLADANTPSIVNPPGGPPASWYIDGDDHSDVSWDVGKTVHPLPLVYCDEAGHLS